MKAISRLRTWEQKRETTTSSTTTITTTTATTITIINTITKTTTTTTHNNNNNDDNDNKYSFVFSFPIWGLRTLHLIYSWEEGNLDSINPYGPVSISYTLS